MVTYPPDPLPLLKGRGKYRREGRNPSLKSLPVIWDKQEGDIIVKVGRKFGEKMGL